MQQDYPDYDLRIVVDGRQDPAWRIVQEAVAEVGFSRAVVSTLEHRPRTCGLKNAALVQLVRDLPAETEIIAMADADCVFHRRWLQELVAPFQNPEVGASYGNRWFWPSQVRWGSLIRYLWNVAAVVPMYLLEIPWGGAFALRADIARKTNLLDKWRHAIVDDAPVRTILQNYKYKIQFVPSLMIVNREECDLPYSLQFIKRQMTWTRLYHANWPPVVIHAFATAGLLGALIALIPLAAAASRWDVAAGASACLAGYLSAMIVLLASMEAGVRKAICRDGSSPFRFTALQWLKVCLAIPLTQVVYLAAVLLAMFRTQVTWRGITYHMRGPWEIRRVSYRPFSQPTKLDAHASL